jgi:hypothetical protein
MTTSEEYKEAMRKLEDWHKFTTYVQPLLDVIKGRVAYLEGKVDYYERHIPSGPHTYSEEFFVQPVNHGVKGSSTSCDERGVGVVKYLANPFEPVSTSGVEINRHPEALLGTTASESGELGSGDAVEGGGVNHDGPRNDGRLHVDYLRRLLERIRLDTEWERNLSHEKDTERLKGSGYEMLANSKRAWQLDAVWDFVKRYNAALGKV